MQVRMDNRVERSRALRVACALAMIVATMLVGAPGAHAAKAPPRGLSATYYDNLAFKRPIMTRTDARVAFNWRAKAPTKKMGKDTFGVRWTGSLDVPKTGRYTFTLTASDGARMWIDGKRRINRWTRVKAPKTSTVTIALKRGRHPIRIDYFDHSGPASVVLKWKTPGARRAVVVPRARLVPPPAANLVAKPWSDPKTWGGRVPAEGTAVTIPAGMSVLLDRDVSLANLTIRGSLVFDRRDLTLEADWIMVHGALQVGMATAPFNQRATIRLRDARAGENIMGAGDKVLGVMGGTLDLHGQARPGWTRLGAHAERGATRITLDRALGWRPGDRIAIASTDFSHDQDEEATITAVDGNVLTLDRALEFTHWGEVQRFDGRPVDERAEVALLSRNVTVEGEEASSAQGFGGQIVVMDGATARVSGTELQRVGQAGQLRRYPIHFHMLRDAGEGSYLTGSSIHHSNNRCATIHGTNKVRVDGNVCFDHKGHGIFLEDGAEQGNVITNNLVLGTRRPADGQRLLASDSSPASYWLTNPDNVVRGNVAGGSDGHGFWLALPEHPTGLFATMYPAEAKAMWPRRMALGEFSGNVAHGNDRDGLHFDNGPRPDGHTETAHHAALANPTDTKSKELVTTLDSFSAYKNRGEGAWLRGSHHRLTRATLADNAIGATFASDESFLQDSLLVGETANVGTPQRWEVRAGEVGRGGRSLPRPWDAAFPVRGFQFYDGRVGVERTTFVNYQPWTDAKGVTREQSGLGYKLDNDFAIHPRNFAAAVRFVNAKPVYMHTPQIGNDGELSSVFLDTDGSVTGSAGRSVTMGNPFLSGAGCEARAEWNAQVCTGDYATLLVGAPGNPAALRPVTVTRGDGQAQTMMASTGDAADDAQTTVLANAGYSVAFNGGTPQRTQFVLRNGRDRWVRVAIPRAEGFRVMRYGCNTAQVKQWCFATYPSSAALDAGTKSGSWYDDHGDGNPTTGTLHLRLVSTGTDWDELTVE